MIFTKAALAGATGVIGLVLGLTLGVTGASAVASHHKQDRVMSHSASQDGQQNQGRQKDSTGNRSGEQRHKRPMTKDDGTPRVQPQSDGPTTQQNDTPNKNTSPTTK